MIGSHAQAELDSSCPGSDVQVVTVELGGAVNESLCSRGMGPARWPGTAASSYVTRLRNAAGSSLPRASSCPRPGAGLLPPGPSTFFCLACSILMPLPGRTHGCWSRLHGGRYVTSLQRLPRKWCRPSETSRSRSGAPRPPRALAGSSLVLFLPPGPLSPPDRAQPTRICVYSQLAFAQPSVALGQEPQYWAF